MNTPITFNGILGALAILVAIVAGIAAIIAIVKWINNAHDRAQKWDNYGMKIDELQTDLNARLQQIQDEQYILTDCMSAVLDGLHQLKCNGRVTEAKASLDNYINKRAHEKE